MAPIQRHEALQPVSREHHFGLLLGWKIQKAAAKNIAPERVFDYLKFAFRTELLPHFKLEEKAVFPVLGEDDSLVKQALDEHRRIESLISRGSQDSDTLDEIRSLLNAHIRFEERVLFQKIQENATAEEFELMMQAHSAHDAEKPREEWPDEFWK